jgi:DNA-binding NarL/FixJ family response regulator
VQSRDQRTTIRVGVADANLMACGLMADGLQRHSQFEVIGYATSAAELLSMVKKSAPDVVLIGCDLEDGKLAGVPLIYKIQQTYPEVHAVLLVDRSEPGTIVQAFRAGAKGVFDRSACHFDRLRKCIVCVQSGQIWANTQQIKYVLEAVAKAPAPRLVNVQGTGLLTKREEELVRLVADGLGNRDIAKSMTLSEHTVKNYMFRIFDKLGISNRVELVLYAFNNSERTLRHEAVVHEDSGLSALADRTGRL